MQTRQNEYNRLLYQNLQLIYSFVRIRQLAAGNVLYLLSFRPQARLCRAEAEESVECASPKANPKVELIYWKWHSMLDTRN